MTIVLAKDSKMARRGPPAQRATLCTQLFKYLIFLLSYVFSVGKRVVRFLVYFNSLWPAYPPYKSKDSKMARRGPPSQREGVRGRERS